ncbi:MAG: type II toxin-antitoxin system RatA family toxin [Parvibaculum sp.]|uniref:type II toxin-antitoxin system RatA family toxin n=1 Tax=Parvibaculum sp. TaxID=2024848 RepID=UPI0025DDA59B|nr:type II toxin-antitoxin system RatA family toxin [Parvibaculum sp.]MCE9649415.1 type II toxin-antitoxin system RatA family toxin [Parvibaculum sp.]
MTAAHQTRDVPYSADQMFELVADIERYPSFLPWCAGARVRKRETEGGNEVLTADLIVAYKVFREQFTSRVTLDRTARIVDVHYVQGPFKYLANKWEFEPLPEGGSRIHFFIDFEFRSVTLQKLMNGVFSKAFSRMMQAFIDHADELYGKQPTSSPGA